MLLHNYVLFVMVYYVKSEEKRINYVAVGRQNVKYLSVLNIFGKHCTEGKFSKSFSTFNYQNQ